MPVQLIMFCTARTSAGVNPLGARNASAKAALRPTWTAVYFAPVPSVSERTLR